MRTTIDFGIDLGTTNSAIAVSKGAQVKVFRSNEGEEYTPSVVHLDARGEIVTGRVAKEQLETDSENTFAEFKLQMGTERDYVFARGGRHMRPEELSSEVLKSLCADVEQQTGERIEASVITVPAAFELPQCEATRLAAQRAGLRLSPLLQEPVAAALAYGFDTDSDKVFWLVYDFGGGTFDAAVVQVRDGVIQVPNYGGDNHLGGKLIDWAIVDELLIPVLTRDYQLTEFRRGNPRWAGAISKLKLASERAKVRCSRARSATIHIDHLCRDDRGEAVDFEFELERPQVERLAEPLILRSINICKRVLAAGRLGPGHVAKVILVGGPTLMPYLRERLEDPKDGLGIRLEFSSDPLTVVARGAALFATGQRLNRPAGRPTEVGQYAVQLEHKPVGADTAPLVGGKIVAPGEEDLSGFTLELVSADGEPGWRSGKLPLGPDGSFVTTVTATKGRQNVFLLELTDPTGARRQTDPDRLTYTVAIDMPEQPLVQSIGIALANNTVDVFFSKGSPLPARKRSVRKTTTKARRGQTKAAILIPVVEGENRRADRNRLIGTLQIHGSQMKNDVPPGTEVEVEIEIDESRVIRTKATIALLEQEFENVIHLGTEPPDLGQLAADFAAEQARLDAVRQRAKKSTDPKAGQILQRIDDERMVHDVEQALAAAESDPDAADKTQKRLLDLQLALDDLEDALEWPGLVASAEQEIDHLRQILREFGKPPDRPRATALEREVARAKESRDADLLRRTLVEVATFRFGVWRANNPSAYLVALFHWLTQQRATMRDPVEADSCVEEGERAISTGDLNVLEGACRHLSTLLPEEVKRRGTFANDPLLR